jgi:hypothetical protein
MKQFKCDSCGTKLSRKEFSGENDHICHNIISICDDIINNLNAIVVGKNLIEKRI